MASRRSMIFDILADAAPAQKAFDKFEDHALGVAASIAAGYAGTKLMEGLGDELASEAAGDKVAAQLDLIPAAAERANNAANAAFRDGMGESLEEVSRGIFEIGEDMVDLNSISETETQKMVTDALAIADAYDKDVSEVTRAAGQLMKNGLAADADEAFDIITAGMQGGLDKTDEFLDTLWEYSEPLGALGLSGTDALAMFGSALDAGAFSVDKAGDAMNEFATRSIDGSKATKDAFETLGLDADDMAARIAEGGPTAKAAFGEVMTALGGMDDAVQQDLAGVGLFGSMWEDAGKGMVLAMDPAKQSVEDVADATESMSDTLYDNGLASAESMRRSFQGWFQDIAAIPGPLGGLAAGVQAFGGDLMAGAGAVGSLAIGLKGLGLGQKIAAMWTGVVTAAQWAWNAALNANPIGLIILAIAALVAGFIWAWNNVDWFREGLISAWEWIKGVWAAAPGFFSGLWDKVVGFFSAAKDWVVRNFLRWTPLGQIISNWGAISAYFGTVKDKVVGFIRGAKDWLITNFLKWTPLGFIISNWGAIIDWFKELPGKIANGFSTMRDKISAPFKWAFNKVAGFWNNTVGRLQFEAPSWVPGIGGKGWGMPTIPMLASGGILTEPTLFLGGEGGEDEVVAPLSKLASFMHGYLDDATVVAPSSRYGSSDDAYFDLTGTVFELRDADGSIVARMRQEAGNVVKANRRHTVAGKRAR